MEKEKHILISCGEASGDLHAANLIESIKQIEPGVRFSGIAGEKSQKAGAQIYWDIKGLSVIGFFDVLKKLPLFFRLKKLMLEKIETEKFAAVILIDFSGFNLRLARSINRRIPVIYYVSPQIWASRQRRIKLIKRYVDKVIVFFKFEQEFYKKFAMDVHFVGHPLLDIVKPSVDKERFFSALGFQQGIPTVALLPGSRKKEIENILPIMLKAAVELNKEIKDIQFVVAKSAQVEKSIYDNYLRMVGRLKIKIIEEKTYDCLNIADFALVASGTATLETAIMQKPFVIIYKMNPLNYLLYKPLIKAPYIGIVNIVAGKRIIAEFIQDNTKPSAIAREALKIITSVTACQEIKKSLCEVKSLLGEKGASFKAARIIIDFLNS